MLFSPYLRNKYYFLISVTNILIYSLIVSSRCAIVLSFPWISLIHTKMIYFPALSYPLIYAQALLFTDLHKFSFFLHIPLYSLNFLLIHKTIPLRYNYYICNVKSWNLERYFLLFVLFKSVLFTLWISLNSFESSWQKSTKSPLWFNWNSIESL